MSKISKKTNNKRVKKNSLKKRKIQNGNGNVCRRTRCSF